MKIEIIKYPGGLLSPASDIEAEKLTKFKNGEIYTVEIKRTRNPAFHRKIFALFNFCFQHWCGDKAFENMGEPAQYERFRKDLTILSGFYEQTVRLNGEVRTEAKSLAYGNMSPEEFEHCYSAVVNAALKHIFTGCDSSIENKLLSFFD